MVPQDCSRSQVASARRSTTRSSASVAPASTPDTFVPATGTRGAGGVSLATPREEGQHADEARGFHVARGAMLLEPSVDAERVQLAVRGRPDVLPGTVALAVLERLNALGEAALADAARAAHSVEVLADDAADLVRGSTSRFA